MIGKKLKELRLNRGLTLKALSEITNISISFLSDVEHNRSNLSIDNLLIVSNALNINPFYFIYDENNTTQYETLPNELIELLKDYKGWSNEDKLELIYYLKVKNLVRSSK